MIRSTISKHKESIPTVIEIPSKDKPYVVISYPSTLASIPPVIMCLAEWLRCLDLMSCKGYGAFFYLFVRKPNEKKRLLIELHHGYRRE